MLIPKLRALLSRLISHPHRWVALHGEFRIASRQIHWCEAGPGDTLRLAHALAWFGAQPNWGTPLTLLSATRAEKLDALFPNTSYVHAAPTLARSGTAPATFPAQLAATLLSERLRPGDTIVHSYVAARDKHLTAFAVRNHTHLRVRIDSPGSSAFDGAGNWNVFRPIRSDAADAIAICLRNEGGPRDTPCWLPRLVLKEAATRRLRVLVYGGPWRRKGQFDFRFLNQMGITRRHLNGKATVQVELMGGEDGHFTWSYRKQMEVLASNALCAIGVNSGGLDLAACAGLPVLRLGEFQKRGFPDRNGHVERWGAQYNDYLSVAANIGLEPRSRKFAEYSPWDFEASLRAFLDAVQGGHANTPEHVIVQHGVQFQWKDLQAHRKWTCGGTDAWAG